jgi:hypothetical protein
VKRRTRKWSFVAQEAKRLAELGISPKEIADHIGVNKSTVTRWIASGKLPAPARKTTAAADLAVSARAPKSPAEWAKAVRAEYDLDETDDQLVALAEEALQVSLNSHVSPSVRLSAAGRFQALVRQLSLVTRSQDANQPADGAPALPEPPKKNPPVQRRVGDPRKVLMMVSGQ